MSIADKILAASAPKPKVTPERRQPRPPKTTSVPRRTVNARSADDRESRYLQAVLDAESENVRTAPQGSRNDTLNRAAFCCAQFEGLDDDEIEAALADAADDCGLPPEELRATIASGIRAGRHEPREIPDIDATGDVPVGRHSSDSDDGEEEGENNRTKYELHHVSELTAHVLDLIERRATCEGQRVPLPFPDYAASTNGGLWSGVETFVGLAGNQKSQLIVQKVIHAASKGVPCLVLTLELTREQEILRLLCDYAGISWSKCEDGRASFEDWKNLRAAKADFDQLPIMVEYGMPGVFKPSDLDRLVKRFRKSHPEGPLNTAVDFAQLLGSDRRAADTRERVGSVLYDLQGIARRHEVAMSVVSSTARQNYALLSNVESAAQLRFENGQRIVGNPAAVLAAAKESGEVEYASDTLLVMSRLPTRLANGDHLILCVQGKRRFGPCTWFALRASQGRLYEFSVSSMDDLPKVDRARGGKAKVDDDVVTRRILDYVAESAVTSRRQAREKVTGNSERIESTWDTLVAAGRLVQADDGTWKESK